MHILTTTDFSPAAEPGLDMAASLAEQLGAKVTLIHVFDPAPFAYIATRGGAAEQYANEREIEDAIGRELERQQQEKLARLPDSAIEAIAGHDAADAIRTYAEQHGVDMIVLSSHGRTGLAHFLIGSVAEKLLRRSPCPVLTVPARSVL